jgi:hypothetical protein
MHLCLCQSGWQAGRGFILPVALVVIILDKLTEVLEIKHRALVIGRE